MLPVMLAAAESYKSVCPMFIYIAQADSISDELFKLFAPGTG